MPENGYRDLAPVARRDEPGDIISDFAGNEYVVEQVGMRYIMARPIAGTKAVMIKVMERIQTGRKV